MRILEVLLVAALVAGLAPALAAARSPIQTQRLMATSVPLEASPTSSVLAAVWQDRLMAMRKKLATLSNPSANSLRPASNVTVNAFAASFTDGDKTIILSALFTTPECVNLSGAAAPNLNNCPMRIAVLQNGEVNVVASANDFPFVAALKDLRTTRRTNSTIRRHETRRSLLSIPRPTKSRRLLILNGVRDTEKSAPIRIPY